MKLTFVVFLVELNAVGRNQTTIDLFFFPVSSAAVGGGEDLRRYWSDYMRRTHVLVYVVDSSDRSRFPLAKAELHRLLTVAPQLPVVILGNKQVSQVSCLKRSLVSINFVVKINKQLAESRNWSLNH